MEWLAYMVFLPMFLIAGGFFFFIELEILTKLKILKLEMFAKNITPKGWLIIALATIINAFLVYLTLWLMPYIIPYKYFQTVDTLFLVPIR